LFASGRLRRAAASVPGVPAAPTPPVAPPPAAPGAPAAARPPGAETTGAERAPLIVAERRSNSLIVHPPKHERETVRRPIKQLDRQPRQVLVEVLVAEITLTDDLRLGVDWAVKSGKFNFASQSISTPSVISPISRTLPIAEGAALTLPGSGLTAFAFATNQFMLLLNTLASLNLVNVLSNPHVLTSENKKAIINVSNSIPIVTSQQVPIGGTTQA